MIQFSQGNFLFELWMSRAALLDALSVTCSVALGGIAIGLVVGLFAALAAVFGPAWLRWSVGIFVYAARGVPALVTIFFVYYGVGVIWRALPAQSAGTLALGLYAAAQMTEIFRGALQSLPRGQIEAAKAIGLTFWLRIVDVVAPLSVRRALPSLVNTAVDLVKASTLVSALGAGDLLLTGQQIAARTFLIPEVYLTLWIFYLSINTTLTVLGRWLEDRFRNVIY